MDLLIFDLDGTLIDSKLDLAHAVNATRVHFGLQPLDVETIGSYVGNGAPLLIRRAMNPDASEERLKQALDFFLAYYSDHKLDYTRTYPGIPEALDQLHSAGVRMAVLTNKPVRVSGGIIDGLNLSKYFERIYGGNSFPQKKPDPVGIDTLMGELGVAPERTMMVGDSSVDIKTARNAGVKACGVTYGFQPDSFKADPPDMIVDRPEELAQAVLAERKQRGGLNS